MRLLRIDVGLIIFGLVLLISAAFALQDTPKDPSAAVHNWVQLAHEYVAERETLWPIVLPFAELCPLKRFPTQNSVLLVAAAEFSTKNGNTNEATRILTECIARSPEYPPAHVLLAELHLQAGRRESTIKSCADTLAYSYGWDTLCLVRVKRVLQTLLEQESQPDR